MSNTSAKNDGAGADKNALLLIDLINPFDYTGGPRLAERAERIVPSLCALVERFRAADAPVVYVNDNFGVWRSSFEETVRECERGRGAGIARALTPARSDMFLLKPHRSGFYMSPLELLLRDLGVGHLVLTGLTTDMCVLATANDACMRNLQVTVVADATESFDEERHQRALELMQQGLQVEVKPAKSVQPTST